MSPINSATIIDMTLQSIFTGYYSKQLASGIKVARCECMVKELLVQTNITVCVFSWLTKNWSSGANNSQLDLFILCTDSGQQFLVVNYIFMILEFVNMSTVYFLNIR